MTLVALTLLPQKLTLNRINRILAKSIQSDYPNDSEALTLPGHLKLGIIAAQAFEQIAPMICQQFELKMTPKELIQTVVLAIWLHDWEKQTKIFRQWCKQNHPWNF